MVVPIRKKMFVIFLVVSAATVVATSNAAGFVTVSAAEDEQRYEEISEEEWATVNGVHERMNTHDYGHYDPTPTLSKPRYKLIPN